jgi:hypothetical protein
MVVLWSALHLSSHVISSIEPGRTLLTLFIFSPFLSVISRSITVFSYSFSSPEVGDHQTYLKDARSNRVEPFAERLHFLESVIDNDSFPLCCHLNLSEVRNENNNKNAIRKKSEDLVLH